MSWIERVESIVGVLKGSNISEMELQEGEFELILRRNPGVTTVVKTPERTGTHQEKTSQAQESYLEVKAPLTGVYYASPSPTAAPFVHVGDTIQVGQTVALIEAMKVFSEIPSDVAGRVVAIQARAGDVLKKGDVLLQVSSIENHI